MKSNTPSRPGIGRFLAGLGILLYLSLAAGAITLASASAQVPGRPVDARALVARMYASGPPPRWLDGDQGRARQALQLLDDAAAHGLDPAHYASAALARRLSDLRTPEDGSAFERDLSIAMLQYLLDLHVGRTGSPYRPDAVALAGFDPVEQLRRAVDTGRLPQAVESAAPAIPLYARVKRALAHYRELSRQSPAWSPLPAPAGPAVVPGDTYPGAPALRERLRLLGDLGSADAGEDGQVYSEALATAIRHFQSRHNLAQDGVLGPATLAALAVPPTHRAIQLGLTLERLRWLPPMQGRIVAVNVPAYRLWAFDLDAPGRALEMRVIVGKAAGTPTPLFIGQMRSLEFNPYWNVPPSIARSEIVPKLARNPAYLRENDMELVAQDGKVLGASGDQALAALRSGTARVRQRPGPKNVLGEVKFSMPNSMNIYLHSTSSRELFQRSRRDLSHGCIRVEQPAELAEFVLANSRDWGAQQVAAAMRPGPARQVALAAPVPVILFYATAVADREGRALFADDIYGRDRELIQAMRTY